MKIDFDAHDFAARYISEGPAAFAPGHDGLLRMVGVLLAERLMPNAEVLIVGAGGGMETLSLSRADTTWRFTGVDPSPAMLAVAREMTAEISPGRLTLIEGTVEDAGSGPYDAATCVLVLGLLPDDGSKLKTLSAIRARMKPGAPFILVDQCFNHDDPLREKRLDRYAAYALAAGVPMTTVKQARAALGASHTVTSASRNEALLRQAGFKEVEQFYQAMAWRGWIACAAGL